MKREKEFKEYLKNKCIDLTSCIKKHPADYMLKITEVFDALDGLRMSYMTTSNIDNGNTVSLYIHIMDERGNAETIEYDTFVRKYQEYDKDHEPEHYIKDENGNMVRVELVCVSAGKDIVITWKDVKTGKTYKTTE